MTPVAQDGTGGPLIAIITGEPSGDLLGARLMAALKAETGGKVRFLGIGGEAMTEQGLDSLVDISELAVMGILEVLPKAPLILRRVKEVLRVLEERRPDVLVTIDSWGFTMRINKQVRKFDPPIPQFHYVAPMVWAWRAKRAGQIAQWVDHLMTLLPNEPPPFEAEGLRATCVGHSVIESGADRGDAEAFYDRHPEARGKPVLCLLPGSRRSETSRLLPEFRQVVDGLAGRYPDLRVVIPTVATVAETVKAEVASWPVPVTVVRGERERYDAFAAADVALAASGTVTLELAMAKVPMVVTYKVSALSAWMFKRATNLKYASLINILLDRPVIPELLQTECRAPLMVDQIVRYLEDDAARAEHLAGLEDGLRALGYGGASPSGRAARLILAAAAEHDAKTVRLEETDR